jgi:hypothetical protein
MKSVYCAVRTGDLIKRYALHLQRIKYEDAPTRLRSDWYRGTGKGHPRTGHEDPEGEKTYHFSFFDLGAIWVGWSTPHPGSFTPRKDQIPVVWEAE